MNDDPNRAQHEQREWRERAACRGVDPELFHPVAEAGPVRDRQVAQAKAVCGRCQVRAACLAEALARIPYGIAGGLTERERRLARRRGTSTAERAPKGPSPWMTRPERTAAGRAIAATGRPPAQVAEVCGVSQRTAERWAALARTSTSTTDTSTTDPGRQEIA